jgi:hypothetical protein
VIDRSQIVANSAASLRLEGLCSEVEVDELLNAWARGRASEEDLREAERRILSGRSLADLPALAAPAGPLRAA